MSIRIELALAAAIVLGTAAVASAAPKNRKPAVYRSVPPASATLPRTAPFSDPNSPEATGGGSPGYNRSVLIAR
jgi:hypothetical protein